MYRPQHWQHTRIQNVFVRESNSDNVFLVDEGKDGPIPLKASYHRTTSETWFICRITGGPMMVQQWMLAWLLCDIEGIRASIAKKPYRFVIFRREGVRTPPLWIRPWTTRSTKWMTSIDMILSSRKQNQSMAAAISTTTNLIKVANFDMFELRRFVYGEASVPSINPLVHWYKCVIVLSIGINQITK